MAVGNRDRCGIGYKGLPSLKVLSNLQKLTLTGMMGDMRDPDNGWDIQKRLAVWATLATFTSVKGEGVHTCEAS